MSKISFLRDCLIPATFNHFGGGGSQRWGESCRPSPSGKTYMAGLRECWAEGPGVNPGSLLLGDHSFSDPQPLFLWNGVNNTKCSREGSHECFVIRLLLWLGWFHFIRWDRRLCKPWSIMQGLLNSSVSWKSSRVCLPRIHNLEKS